MAVDTDDCNQDDCTPWLQSSVSAANLATVLMDRSSPSGAVRVASKVTPSSSDAKRSLEELQFDEVNKLAKSNTETADLQLLRRCFNNSDTKVSQEELQICSVSVAFGQLVNFI